MTTTTTDTKDQQIAEIAARVLGIATLATQKSDRLDFHDLAVWSIREALEAAYEAGRAERMRIGGANEEKFSHQ